MEIEFEDLCIEYKETDDSFSHEFGIEKKIGFELVKVEEYCETYGYKDITNTMSAEMSAKVDRIIQENL